MVYVSFWPLGLLPFRCPGAETEESFVWRRLRPPRQFRPKAGDFRFSGLPGGNLLVLDTGHPGTEHATRAVEYDLDFDLDDDGVHWKASEVWSWGEPEKLYDGGPGMVSILANKNVLLLEGSVIANPGISPLDPANSTWVRLVELDRSIQPNEVVYELHLKEKAPESPVRWSSLSVSRIDTLYPPGYVVAPVP